MKYILSFIIFLIPFIGFSQADSIEIMSVNETFYLDKKNAVKSTTPITAYDLSTNYLCFASDGKISIYNLIDNTWKTQDFTAFTKSEVQSANFGQKLVNSKEINIVKIDTKRNKVGYTLKYAIFKDIVINTLKTDICTWQGSSNYELEYLKQDDGYVRFTKFYLDEQSMDGELDIYLRKDLKNKTHFYKKSNQSNIVLPKISSLKINKTENLFAAKTYDYKLLVWNKNKPEEINTYRNDTLNLVSFVFNTNDSITALYSDGNIYVLAADNFNNLLKIKQGKTDILFFDSFIYNQNRNLYVGTINHSEIILFKINNGSVDILSKTKVNRTIRDYKISEDGKLLSIR